MFVFSRCKCYTDSIIIIMKRILILNKFIKMFSTFTCLCVALTQNINAPFTYNYILQFLKYKKYSHMFTCNGT